MSEGQELSTFEEKTRVTSLHVGRVYNLGNYENMRVEVTVQVASGDDPGRVLRTLEGILRDLRAKGPDSYEVSRARRALEKPEAELDEVDLKRLDKYRQVVAEHEAAMQKREAARAALSTLEYSTEHIDHKDKWEDDEY